MILTQSKSHLWHTRFACAVALLPLLVCADAFGQDEPPPVAASQPAGAVALCPVTSEPISREHWARFRGKRVYFCRATCIERFRDDPYAYTDGVRAQWAAQAPPRVQVTCPVTGKPVRRDIYVERRDDDVYFATPEAKQAWREAPDRYAAALRQCYSFQTGCAACGNDIHPEAFVDHAGKRVYFCCDGCAEALDSDRESCLRRVREQVQANRASWEKTERAQARAAQHPRGKSKPPRDAP